MKKMYLSFTLSLYCFAALLNAQCVDPSLVDFSVYCPTVMSPVCGCDGETYANACVAEYQGGITSYSPGFCNNSNFCYVDNPNIVYCLYYWEPVCGCDGMTRTNSCLAESAGLVAWYPGGCNCVPVDDFSVEFIDGHPNEAYVSWDATEAYDYELWYRPVGVNQWNVINTHQFSVALNHIRLEGLEPGKMYRFKLRSSCTNGVWDDFTPVQSYKTPKCEAPMNITTTQLYSNKVRLDWNHNPFTQKYQVFYREAGSNDMWEKKLVGVPGRNWKILKDLSPGISYEYKVRSYCLLEYGPFSPLAYFTNSPTGNPLRMASDRKTETIIRPNPVRHEMLVNVQVDDAAEYRLSVINMLGQPQKELVHHLEQGEQTILIDLDDLPVGQYILLVEYGGNAAYHKFIKS